LSSQRIPNQILSVAYWYYTSMSSVVNSTSTTEANRRTIEPICIDESENIAYQHLKPADGGRDAWQVLTAAFLFEALLWGKLGSPLYDLKL
jgi:hypothetical protein